MDEDSKRVGLAIALEALYEAERVREIWDTAEAEELERAILIVSRWLLEGRAAGVRSGRRWAMRRPRRKG